MKAIIAGTRTFLDLARLSMDMDSFMPIYNITEVVCGEAQGADSLGKIWAQSHNIDVKSFPADWEGLGRKAGPIRNEQMGDYADIAFCFWDGKSSGTKHMIGYMKRLQKPCVVVLYKQPPPARLIL